MILSPEDQAILDGKQGEVLQKVMKSVVVYGETFGADHLVPIAGSPHLVTSFGANTIQPYFDMLDELIEAGLKSKEPFTVDPRPMEYERLNPGLVEKLAFNLIFGKQAPYEQQLKKLGLKDENSFTCACYLPEVGNTPAKGDFLAWSESSAVVFANSVLGARTNRNSGGIDLMCDIIGKAPYFGLLTDEGRHATWLVEVKTSSKPNAQLLGSAIGIKVMEDVPYIVGMDRFLGTGLNPATEAYLKDMGAATASNGAVGLYHVENITPEAVQSNRSLLKPGYQTYVIDDHELERVYQAYPLLWKDANAQPDYIFVGCPHLARHQLESWIDLLENQLRHYKANRLKIPVYLFTAPDIQKAFIAEKPDTHQTLLSQQIHITSICPLMYMNNPLCGRKPIVTNSNKLRTYTTARFYLDEDVLQIAITGKLPSQGGK